MVFTAYANSVDGTKDFTKVKPNENLYYSSLLYSSSTITAEETGFKNNGGWATITIPYANLRKILKTGKKYFISYDFELLSLTEGTTPYNQAQHGTLLLHGRANPDFYSTVVLTQYTNAEIMDMASKWTVGSTVHHEKSFVAPPLFEDPNSNYSLLSYTRRSMNADGTLNKVEAGRFSNIKIEDGETGTVYLLSPIDNLSKSYMRYVGTSETDSNDPKDYTWAPNIKSEVTHTIVPEDATYKGAVYTASNKAVASLVANQNQTGVLVTPEGYGTTSLTAKATDSDVSTTIPVAVTKEITEKVEGRNFLDPYGTQNKVLVDIRSEKVTNLLNGTGNMVMDSPFAFRSNSSASFPISMEVITGTDGINYQRVRRTKLADDTWGTPYFSLYMIGIDTTKHATEDFVGTGYWLSFYVRSNADITLSSNGLYVNEYSGSTVYNKSSAVGNISLKSGKWQQIKLFVPASEEAHAGTTQVRAILTTMNIAETTLASCFIDIAKPMVSKEEPFYWLPSPEDVGVPHGQPNLLNGTSKDWKEYTFTGWTPAGAQSFDLTELGVKVGDTVTVQAEIENPADSGVTLTTRFKQQLSDTDIRYSTPAFIPSGTTALSVSTYTIPDVSVPLQVFDCLKGDNTVEAVGVKIRRAKFIKGDKTLMDAWTPSFNDFSASKYPFNPYYEIPTERYPELQSDTYFTNSTKIIGERAETRVVFDTVNAVKERFPKEFSGLTTNADLLAKFNEIVTRITVVVPFKGSSSAGAYAEQTIITNEGKDSAVNKNITDTLSNLPSSFAGSYTKYIQEDLTMVAVVRTNETDGVTESSVILGNPTQTITIQPKENPEGEPVTITVDPLVKEA